MFKDLAACCAGPRKVGGVERGKSIGEAKPADSTPTVSISCTMLILECKLECAQRGERMLAQLDDLYAKYKAKELEPNDALQQLTKLVGETCVEQAALVLNNEHDPKCDLVEGWIEYYDDAQALPYYHNPRTKVTQWEKPAKPKQGFSSSIKNFFDKPVAETKKEPGDSRRVSITASVSKHKVAMSASL